jgi:hypothetical protein
MQHPSRLPAVKAHALLAALTFLPSLVHIPYSLSIVLHAGLTVYVGSWRSLRSEEDGAGAGPQERMSSADAMRFPLVGSCVLFGLFLCFKFLPKELVNLLLAGYITVIGAVVVVGAVLPFVERFFPAKDRDRALRLFTLPKVPFLIKEPTPVELTVPEAALAAPALAVGVWCVLGFRLGFGWVSVEGELIHIGDFPPARPPPPHTRIKPATTPTHVGTLPPRTGWPTTSWASPSPSSASRPCPSAPCRPPASSSRASSSTTSSGSSARP